MNDNNALFESSPELKMAIMILDKIDVPMEVHETFDHAGTSHDITIRRVGLNPSMVLNVFRSFGVEGIKHSAPTLYFWNASGAPKDVCDAFKTHYGDRIFDVVQKKMLQNTKAALH